ncbi:MAG: hypothetical protein SXU28_04565 [Pseudomonadota bacterium]|nr:hypothetical protein [Pseudomonadota bacterium]
MRALLAIGALGTLSGCDLLFPEDWRLGEEPLQQCLNRLNSDIDMLDFREAADTSEPLVPTFTYDITLLSFEDKQALILPGADETLGARLMKSTNEISTAKAQFMQWPVDEKGAFFFGVKPALFRVRGEPQNHSEILTTGCERLGANARLISVSLAAVPAEPEPEPDETDRAASDPANDQLNENTQ